MNRAPAQRIMLSFKDSALERTFLVERGEETRQLTFVALLLSAVFYGAFAFIDHQMYEQAIADKLIALRIAGTVLILAVAFWVRHGTPKNSQMQISGGGMGAILGIALMMVIAPMPDAETYYAGLVLVNAYCIGALQLRVAYAICIGLWTLGLYFGIAFFANPAPLKLIILDGAIITIQVGASVIAAYNHEIQSRKTFLKQREIIGERETARAEKTRSETYARVSADYFWVCDTDGRLAELTTGSKDEELKTSPYLSKTLGQFGFTKNTSGERKIRRHFLAKKSFRNIEVFLKNEDRILLISGEPQYSSNAHFEGFIGSATDVTDARRNEMRLKETTEQQRSVLDSLSEGLLSFGANGIVTLSNRSWSLLSGRRQEETLGHRVYELFDPDSRSTLEHAMSGNLKDGPIPLRLHRDDGGEIFLEGRMSRTPNDWSYLSLTDLTQTKKAEALARQAALERETAVSVTQQTLGRLTNTIRTPLMGMIGMARLLSERTGQLSNVDKEGSHYIATLLKSAVSLAGIVDSLIEYIRLSGQASGKQDDLQLIPFDLASIVLAAQAVCSPLAEIRGLTIGIGGLASHDTWVVGDPDRLRQVLIALLSDAAQRSEAGPIMLRIDDIAQPTFVFTIECASVLPRSDESVDAPLAEKRIRSMGGNLNEGIPPHDALWSFTVELTPIQHQKATKSQPLDGSTILLVDDSDSILKHVGAILTTAGAQVRQALHPDEARAFLDNDGPFDAVVLDYIMEECSGIELGEEIRENPRLSTVKRILLTGAEFGDEERRTLLKTFHAILMKGGAEGALVQTIVAAISSHIDATHEDDEPFHSNRWLNVLVADDSEPVRLVLCKLLDSLGHRVTAVKDGREALHEIDQRRFDLVLLDIMMPSIDGMLVARSIRAKPQYRNTPLIAITANAEADEQQRYRNAGFDEIMTKPINAKDLRDVISRITGHEVPTDTIQAQPALIEAEDLGRLSIDKLRAWLDGAPDLARDLADSTRNEVAKYVSILSSSDAHTPDEIEIAWHTLKALVKSIGMEPLGRFCEERKGRAQTGRSADADARDVAVLVTLFERVQPIIDQVVERYERLSVAS